MEKLNVRYKYAQKAFGQLEKTIHKMKSGKYQADYEDMRDSLIQRFEFCIDTLWKLSKLFLTDNEKIAIESSTPRSIFRSCADAGLISNDDYVLFIQMIEDRNMTSHTYNEDLAEEIAKKIPDYFPAMKAMLDRIKPKI